MSDEHFNQNEMQPLNEENNIQPKYIKKFLDLQDDFPDIKYNSQLWRTYLTKPITDLNIEEFSKVLRQIMPSSNFAYLTIKNDNLPLPVMSVIKDLVTFTCDLHGTIQIPGSKFIDECFSDIEEHFTIGIVNCAAWLIDLNFMSKILVYPAVLVDSTYFNLMPLNLLAKKLTTENFNKIFECMQLLINYGANPNIPDEENRTPIFYITENKKLHINQQREILTYFFNYSDIDLDASTGTGTYINTKFLNIQISNKSFSTSYSLVLSPGQFVELDSYLHNGKEDEFWD